MKAEIFDSRLALSQIEATLHVDQTSFRPWTRKDMLLLPASSNPSYSLTIYHARTGSYSLSVGLIWWMIGVALAIAYFTFLYRSFKGKVVLDVEGGY